MPTGGLKGVQMVTDLVCALEAALQYFGAQTSIGSGRCSTMAWLNKKHANLQTISGGLRCARFLKHKLSKEVCGKSYANLSRPKCFVDNDRIHARWNQQQFVEQLPDNCTDWNIRS